MNPKSFFDRPVTIRSHGEMMARLAQRSMAGGRAAIVTEDSLNVETGESSGPDRLPPESTQGASKSPAAQGDNRDVSTEPRNHVAAVPETSGSYSRSDPSEDARTPAGTCVASPDIESCERSESTQAGEPIPTAGHPVNVTAAPSLTWLPPVRNADETGHQCAGGTDYVVRKTLTEGKVMYWAWYQRKLLGYATDAQGARDFCQAHLEDCP